MTVCRKILFVIGLSFALGFDAATCRAGMTLQSLYGAVTSTETASFKSFMAGESPPAGQTYDNTIADGTAGMEAEALGLMYEVTNDPVLLNQLISYSDQFLALRNDFTDRRAMWTGNIDPVWLTKPATNSDGSVNTQAGYAGCENNDIAGHIALCARLILESPWLWNVTVPDGNPHTNGVTYFQRAKTYITQMDQVQDAYMLKWFINTNNFQIVAPTNAAWTAEDENVNAYNRQMMFLNGFQRLSECHQLLGDSPSRVTEYDAIVTAAMNVFIAALQPYTTNGMPVWNWTYAPGSGGSEDNTLHSTYDIWGITRAWESGRYNLSNATLVPFANTLQYVMNVSTNHISYYVNGTSSPNSTRSFIYPGWMPVANFGSETYFIMANMDSSQQSSTAIYDALILWVKNARYIGTYPTNNSLPDYTISTPWTQSVVVGSNITCKITLNPLAGFTNTVTFGAGHLPRGVAAGFSPGAITNGSGSVTLMLTASNTAVGGIFALTNGVTVSGTSSIGVRTAPLALVVKPHPVIMNTSLTGTNLVMGGTNGFANSTFYLLGGTNLFQPFSKWTVLATNVFGTNGNFSATNKISGTLRFFALQY
ncbi:MAG TPA: hypothetical protein VK742_15270 [Candidatus Sulfotelmatobacter sp.]|jgi:hypothetical protein|nr:hypothetical protein [Candidatus Sulfotelmatobacter sp.]